MAQQIEIKHRWTDAVLFSFEATDEQQACGLAVRAALEAAVKACANLSGANLSGAYGEKLALVGDRPFMQVGPIGSRCDYASLWLTDAGPMVRAGCFWRGLEDFEFAVRERHENNDHAQEYAAAIELFRAHVRLWTPAVEAKQPAEVAAA